ncbi:MAG: protein-disulfide reductase DsbD domain-containing protein [Cereibacter changlensis]
MMQRLASSLLVALSLALPIPAAATTQDEILRAAVLPGWRSDSGTHIAALRLTLAPGWKTYWRSPGDAGIPPLFDWAGSENVRSVRFHWPRPHVFDLNGMQSIGYKGELVLPLEVTAIDASQPIRLRANVELGVCRDICIPAALTLDAALPLQGAADAVIDAALRQRPQTGREAGMAGIACQIEPIADGLRLTTAIDMPALGQDEVVVLEPGQGSVWASDSVSARQGNRLTATTELVAASGQPFALDRSKLTVTVLGPDRAVEIRGCPAP